MGRYRPRIDPDHASVLVPGGGGLGTVIWLFLCEMTVLTAYRPLRRLLFPSDQAVASDSKPQAFRPRQETGGPLCERSRVC